MIIFFPSTGGYPPFWGNPTSTSNFCEEDYHVTSYTAEFINTVSNAGYLYYGVHGLLNNWNRRPFLHFNLQYLALIGVGLSSGVFHMTLKRSFQSADKLSMFFGAGIVLHRVMTFDKPHLSLLLGVSLVVGLSFVFYVQYQLSQQLYHWVTFAAMIFVIWRKVAYMTKIAVSTAEEKILLQKLGSIGIWTFVAGFGFWLIDVKRCADLRDMRKQLGMPLEFLLEFHGWWHILTAVGVYVYMVLVEYLHLANTPKTRPRSIQFSAPFQTPVVLTPTGPRC